MKTFVAPSSLSTMSATLNAAGLVALDRRAHQLYFRGDVLNISLPGRESHIREPVAGEFFRAVRVRISRSLTARGKLQGRGFYIGHWYFLDGLHAEAHLAYRNTRTAEVLEWKQEFMPPKDAVIAARTKDTVDFGRLQQAALALIGTVDNLSDDASPEQQESILRGYQGLLAWREDLQRHIDAADAALDVVSAKVRSIL